MTFQSIYGPIKPVVLLKTPLYQLERSAAYLFESIASPFRHIFFIRDENHRLRTEIKALRIIEEASRELMLENVRLQSMLDFREASPTSYIAARVIFSGIRQWPEILVLDKGSLDGIRKDMAVRTPEGLAGKVTEVAPNFSRVLSLTDVRFSASVRLQDTRVEGVLTGRGDSSSSLKYISAERDVKAGALLITSGLDGVFPKGIPVGTVRSVSKGDELFLKIDVTPIIEPSRIEEVLIVGAPTNKQL